MKTDKVERELLLKIIENWGNAVVPISEMVKWLQEYASQSKQGWVSVDIEEEAKKLYIANYNDYALVNADESFRKGIELGIWGMNEKFKSLTQVLTSDVSLNPEF